jgi:uncharacterized protein YjbI with pentapeptide repeats
MLQVRVLLGAPVFTAAVAPPVQEAAMVETKNKTLTGQVRLDGATFRDCEFIDARLVYDGGTPPNFINCRFTNTNFTFQEAAGNTVNFLRAMAPRSSNMRDVVFGLMPELHDN